MGAWTVSDGRTVYKGIINQRKVNNYCTVTLINYTVLFLILYLHFTEWAIWWIIEHGFNRTRNKPWSEYILKIKYTYIKNNDLLFKLRENSKEYCTVTLFEIYWVNIILPYISVNNNYEEGGSH